MDRTGAPPAAEGYVVGLTHAPERPDCARTSLLPGGWHGSAEELRLAFPDVADALLDGRLFGPLWSELGTKYEAAFATYAALRAAFADMAAHLRTHRYTPVDDSARDVQLVVHVTGPAG